MINHHDDNGTNTTNNNSKSTGSSKHERDSKSETCNYNIGCVPGAGHTISAVEGQGHQGSGV